MDILYALTFCTYPGRCTREELPIGLFTTEEEARAVERRYRREVPGFKDFYCDSVITPLALPEGWNGKSKLYSVCGWNLDGDGEETDILRSDCYRTREAAREGLRRAKAKTPREKWSIDAWTVGECDWAEGFIREYPSGREPLTLAEINQRLDDGARQQLLCRTEFQYSDDWYYLYPLRRGDKLFLAMEEDDFLLDGFTVRHLRDVEKLEFVSERGQRICRSEGLTDQLIDPGIPLENWQAVFAALKDRGGLISITQETLDDRWFDVGVVESLYESHVVFRRVDGEGVWQESVEICYDHVTAVNFDSRYLRIFGKYL